MPVTARTSIPPKSAARWRCSGMCDGPERDELRTLIVLVEQYLDFACELGDNFAVMDRGAVKYSCDRSNLDPGEISRQMAL